MNGLELLGLKGQVAGISFLCKHFHAIKILANSA